MDLYNENRTMIHMDAVARKDKEATISVWGDYTAVLLDHYCTFSSSPQNLLYSESFLVLLTKEEARGEVTRYYVISRVSHLPVLRSAA